MLHATIQGSAAGQGLLVVVAWLVVVVSGVQMRKSGIFLESKGPELTYEGWASLISSTQIMDRLYNLAIVKWWNKPELTLNHQDYSAQL
jgi:hypothetical protein